MKTLAKMCGLAPKNGSELSDREFGNAYKGVIEDTLNFMQVDSHGLSGFERTLNDEYRKVKKRLSNHAHSEIICQRFSNFDVSKFYNQEDFALPTYVVDSEEYDKHKKGTLACACRGSKKIPFILLSERLKGHPGIFNGTLLHEAQHVVHNTLLGAEYVPINNGLNNPDKLDFLIFRNELLSKLAGKSKPIGYTLNGLRKTPEKESAYVRENRIEINNMFPIALNVAKGEGATYSDFMKGVFYSQDFEELHNNIVNTGRSFFSDNDDFDETLKFARYLTIY